jgi:hypothetical protein
MAKSTRTKDKTHFGRGEWFGELFKHLSPDRSREFLVTPNTAMECPFMAQVPKLAPLETKSKQPKTACNKAGGVCSLRKFSEPRGDGDLSFGPLVTTCPNRFLEDGAIVKHIGQELLGTAFPLFAKELPFLRKPKSAEAGEAIAETEEDEEVHAISADGLDAGREDVGRIDLVLVDPNDQSNWCAVELQAVYFSGASMAKDKDNILNHTNPNIAPFPGGARRPDFRSSGPKRLMPQLMIKVPSLRRWGKKMVVVVDRPFLDAMDAMETVDHISNSDIVWVVVSYDEASEPGKAKLVIDQTLFTTLDHAIVGLTAGSPTTLPEFEAKLAAKVKPVF